MLNWLFNKSKILPDNPPPPPTPTPYFGRLVYANSGVVCHVKDGFVYKMIGVKYTHPYGGTYYDMSDKTPRMVGRDYNFMNLAGWKYE